MYYKKWVHVDLFQLLSSQHSPFLGQATLGPVSDFMINAYCKNLEDTFTQMVYFGVLKEENAQCFGVLPALGITHLPW